MKIGPQTINIWLTEAQDMKNRSLLPHETLIYTKSLLRRRWIANLCLAYSGFCRQRDKKGNFMRSVNLKRGHQSTVYNNEIKKNQTKISLQDVTTDQ